MSCCTRACTFTRQILDTIRYDKIETTSITILAVSTCVRFPEGLNLYCKQRSCYDVLELEETATSTEIKKAYRRMSLKYHPDKSDAEDAQTVFMSIATAYEVLSDEKLVFCTRLSSIRHTYKD